VFYGVNYHDRIVLYLKTYLYVKYYSNEFIYLNSCYDYRGRIYYKGSISPTYNKSIRPYLVIIKETKNCNLINAENPIIDLALIEEKPYFKDLNVNDAMKLF
jgi:hypothetical protein